MSSAKELAVFKLAPPIEEAWNRLANQGGSRSDLASVVDFLAKLWGFDQAGPGAFDQWLSGNGIKKQDVPLFRLSEYRKTFEQDQETKLRRTRELLEGIALGSHSSEFFTLLSGFTSEFKRLAYRIALSVSHGEGVVFALSALSQENPQIAQEWVKDLPSSPVLQTFLAYLRGARQPLALEVTRISATTTHEAIVDRLFYIATLPLKDLEEELQKVSAAERGALVRLAESLLQRVSDRGFGRFVKLNLSVFVCVADSKSKAVSTATQTIVSTGEPGVAQVLALMGRDFLAAEMRDPNNLVQAGRGRFLAAVIDAWRRYYPDSIRDFAKELKAFAAAKAPVVAVAARAAIAQPTPADRNKLEKFLVRKLQTDQDRSVREWLLRNPEFVRYFQVEKASFKTLQVILEACAATNTALAADMIQQVLREPAGPDRYAYWEEAIRVLATLVGEKGDDVFSEFLLQQIQEGWGPQIQKLMEREYSQTLLRRSFWKLLERSASENGWGLLFGAYRARATEADLIALIESSYNKGGSLRSWILSHLVPTLLEDESVSPNFYRSIDNRDVVAAIAKHLAQITAESAIRLRDVANEWKSARASIKKNLLVNAQAGLRIASQNGALGKEIQTLMATLAQEIEDWARSDSPKFDPTIEALVLVDLPYASPPNATDIERLFRGQPRGPNDFAFFAGKNPWAIDVIFGQQQGPWPKPELLLDQVIRSFLFVIKLAKRADDELRLLGRTIRVGLAVVVRDTLSHIESDLAGYFIFRDILDRNGLHPVLTKLGERIEQKELSSQKHKVIRDPNRRGVMRAFSLGIRVDDMIVGSTTVEKSGDDDDRD